VKTVLRGLFLALVAAWIYAPCLHGTWLWDDGLEIAQNLSLRAPGGWWQPWLHPAGMDYFPLKSSLQWFEWRFWGANPFGYHLSNLGLHIASSLLVWRLLERLGIRAAFVGGLLFAIHPLAVESVAWISEFKNTVSLPFLLLACLAYVEFDRAGRRAAWVLALLGFLAALACKTSVVMFPFCLLLFCWWRRGRLSARDGLDAAPFFAASCLLGAATVWFQSTRAIGSSGIPDTLGERLSQAGWSIVSYVRQALCPAGLAPVYLPIHGEIPPWVPWLGIAAVLGLFWRWRAGWGRHALLGWGWFLLNLAPILGLVPMAYMRISPRADHFAYVSLVGYAGIAAACVDGALTALRRRMASGSGPRLVVAVAVAAVAVPLAIAARSYAAVYHDEEALWTYAVARSPDAWLARNNLGKVMLEEGRATDAAKQFGEAARIRPDSPEAHANWGNALEATGQDEEARSQYEAALAIDPGFAGGHYDLGLSLLRSGRLDEAAAQFEAALRIDPSYVSARNNLGLALARSGRLEQAIVQFRAALRIDPDLAEAHLNLGNALFRLGGLDEAVAQYHEALRINPGYSGAHNNLGYALEKLGRQTEADAEFNEARRTANH
jgi:tetratricopeptide (TPR) repeat protein